MRSMSPTAPGPGRICRRFACAVVLAQHGIEPVLQFTMRDRNRLALQGDLIGAATLGHSQHPLPAWRRSEERRPAGDQGGLRHRQPRADGHGAPAARAGHAAHPAAPSIRRRGSSSARPMRPRIRSPIGSPTTLKAKIEAGADFVQTQYCFDLGLLRRYLARLGDHGILERLFVIVGIGPLASAKSARWMNENLLRRAHPARHRRAAGAAPAISAPRAARSASSCCRSWRRSTASPAPI